MTDYSPEPSGTVNRQGFSNDGPEDVVGRGLWGESVPIAHLSDKSFLNPTTVVKEPDIRDP